MKTDNPKHKQGGALIRYHDDTRVINTGDRLEMRAVDIVIDGAALESLEYTRSQLCPGFAWHLLLQAVIEKGIKEYTAMAMMDSEVHE